MANELRYTEQQLLNLCSEPSIGGDSYSGAQSNTDAIIPSTSSHKICITAILVSVSADDTTVLLEDDSAVQVAIIPTVTLMKGTPFIMIGGAIQTLYRGIVGKKVQLTSSGSVVCKIWYYEAYEDVSY